MAHYDSTTGKIVEVKPYPAEGYPNWEVEDCGCCNGLEWGGEEPRECSACSGGGYVYHHIPSGVRAQYPGGPLLGRWKQ